ncbi:MAG: thioredoxin family protein [Rhodothermales bacterium]|nr:thioredoxin family protein [Rhodothermales bacterium]
MVAVTSNMLALGTPAPAFALADPDGVTHSFPRADDRPWVVMFICNHCPFVKLVADELAAVSRDYQGRADFVAINSNDTERYPQDGPDAMRQEAASRGYQFPYLLDASQEVAQAYMAACTPDFFVFDSADRLAYRGQLDDSRPGNGVPPSGRDLRAALDALLAGKSPSGNQRPAMGCNIKWKPGNEPPYFR